MIKAVYAYIDDVPFDKLLKASDSDTAMRAQAAYNKRKGTAIALARLMAVRCEAQYLNKSTDEVILCHEPEGRPYFKNQEEYVSISHCDNAVLVCISDNPVGCDLQSVKSFHPGAHRRFFTPEDYDYIVSSENVDEAMTTVWTRRESIIKILGAKEARKHSYGDLSEIKKSYGIDFYEAVLKDMKVSIAGENLGEVSLTDGRKIIDRI